MKLELLENEAKNIEQSFTEYIVPDQEKSIVNSIFEQNMQNKTSVVQMKNLTTNSSISHASRNQE
jgi:hypothetical protein